MKLFLYILIVVLSTSCCSFCKMESTIEHQIDTIYKTDTIKVLLIPESYSEISSDLTIIPHDSIRYDSVTTTYDWLSDYINDTISAHYDTISSFYTDIPFNFYIDTIYASTSYAIASAFVDRSRLNLNIINKKKATFILDSLESLVFKSQVEVTYAKRVARDNNVKLKKYRRLTWIFGSIIFIGILIAFSDSIKKLIGK